MCLIAFAWQASSRYRLVLAANRDEFHDRPSLAAHWWRDSPTVYGGRDLNAGGTWLAISRRGKLAAVTNYRERPHRGSGERSRGELGASFVSGERPAMHYARALHSDAERYAGFNLLLFDWEGSEPACAYLSNRHPAAPIQAPAPGVHTLSNHLLNTRWPKSLRLGSVMERMADCNDPVEPLFEALADQRPVSPQELPADADQTDPDALTRTPFVFDARYGTRASTVVTVDHAGHVCFVERSWTWSPDGARSIGERRLAL